MIQTRRAIDPSPGAVWAMVADAAAGLVPPFRVPRPDWTDLFCRAWAEAEGWEVRTIKAPGGERLMVRLVWWADALGRKHWVVEAGAELPVDPTRHPLEWIAPPLSCGWRERGAVREFVVICRCGFAGRPESLAWMGESCGPCHDREQEGLPPLGRAILRSAMDEVGILEVLADGRLVTERHGWQDDVPLEPAVSLWPSVDADASSWIAAPQDMNRLLTAHDRFVAISTLEGQVLVLAAQDGAVLDFFSPGLQIPDSFLQARFAGAAGERLVILCHSLRAPWKVGIWEVSPEGRVGRRLHLLHGGPDLLPTIAVSPPGRHFLITTGTEVRSYDVVSGRAIERLLAAGAWHYGSCILPDGAVVACIERGGSRALARWASLRDPGPPDGIWGWLTGPPCRNPERTEGRPDICFTPEAAPDGEIMLVEGDRVTARSAETLHLRASFRPSNVQLNGNTHLAPDGRLLALTDKGLAVWPWRELMGTPGPGGGP